MNVKNLVIAYFLCFISLNVFAQHDSKPVKRTAFISKSGMDLTKTPGNNFYLYASGNWIKNNPVPPKETRWGSFNALRDKNINAVRTILSEAENNINAAPGSIERRVGDFYASAMNKPEIEKIGYKPIKKELEKIDRISDLNNLIDQAVEMRVSGAGTPFFNFNVGQDRKNVTEMVPQLQQGGITLPDRDYYLKNDSRNLKIQAAYKIFITKLFTLTGTSQLAAEKTAAIIFNIEKTLAKAQMSRVEMRDPYKTYNKFSVNNLSSKTPHLNWHPLLIAMKAKGQDSVLVNAPDFFYELDALIASQPLESLKAYLKWNILKTAAPHLSSEFVAANFAYARSITGQKLPTPRWQRMSALIDLSIGDLLGQLYVEKHFKPEAKVKIQELVANLIKAYEIRIKNLDWMSDETKQKALDKLQAFTPKIAYPDNWKNYEGLHISRKSFFQNVRNARAWTYQEMVDQLGKPVDKTKWGMTAPTVNAYYNPVNNEIVFPAGILQFPFFDPNADDAVNYGGIGAVIGHEISHGFDDSGSQYDKDGTLRNWWTDEDRAHFNAKATALQKQYDAYTVLDTIHVNGKLTLGENIGDLGGLNAAYEAFKMTKQGKSNVTIDGLMPDQRFFLSWAQVWRGNILKETAAQLIVTDPHSPGPYRTIGPLVNMDAWYEAFYVKPGDKLYKKPEERIKIW